MIEGQHVCVADLAAWSASRIPSGRRFVLGIAGPPAAGKSTLSANLAVALSVGCRVPAQIAPMDGFHRTNAELSAAGALDRKGEPDTFDVAGFLAHLKSLRESAFGEVVHWPIFDRGIDDPTPDALRFSDEKVAIVEGNYLLLEKPGWREVAGYLDEVWYLDAADQVIVPRLTERHLRGGKSAARVRAKVADSDMPNARLIAATSVRADLVLREIDGRYRIETVR
ncbi:nucleoside/nucleotide kinase family protein [Nocardia bovistercoris]|uniref:Nucleoside/nucleotide kinase family protein n=1 Tax=Nocardia bovistercoris TaxID=2785916 RepID=A0A931N2U6_9NOCA|nr:nucleoside/nucleotide kinase family protein [Nocardia bovistercoris]MBH0776436.1 nucleoside/nucleotide kinase family protein [Nocardia bovistercoris]